MTPIITSSEQKFQLIEKRPWLAKPITKHVHSLHTYYSLQSFVFIMMEIIHRVQEMSTMHNIQLSNGLYLFVTYTYLLLSAYWGISKGYSYFHISFCILE